MGNSSSSKGPTHDLAAVLPAVIQTVDDAIGDLRRLTNASCQFREHRARLVGRRACSSFAEKSPEFHKAIAYTTDVSYHDGSFRERILYRVEFLDDLGNVVFMSVSTNRGPIHDQVAYAEEQSGMGGPFTWLCYKDPMKHRGVARVEIGPLQFLETVKGYLLELQQQGRTRGGFSSGDFARSLWSDRLKLPEVRQIINKVKYIRDWGDLTQQVVVDIKATSSSRSINARVQSAMSEMVVPSPRPGVNMSPMPSPRPGAQLTPRGSMRDGSATPRHSLSSDGTDPRMTPRGSYTQPLPLSDPRMTPRGAYPQPQPAGHYSHSQPQPAGPYPQQPPGDPRMTPRGSYTQPQPPGDPRMTPRGSYTQPKPAGPYSWPEAAEPYAQPAAPATPWGPGPATPHGGYPPTYGAGRTTPRLYEVGIS